MSSLTLTLSHIPSMDDCVDRVGSANFVTKLDLKVYWQVPLTMCLWNKYICYAWPFLTVRLLAYEIHQWLFSPYWRDYCGINNCKVYLDDTVACLSDLSEHAKTLSEIFECHCTASPEHKCYFGKAVVTYLDKQVGQGCVCPVAAKPKANLDFPAPKTRCELRHFLGMAGYYCAFSKSFS